MSPEDWKTVTRDDKKRVMRRRGKKTLTTTGYHPTSTVIDDHSALSITVERCMADLEQTDLYQALTLWLQEELTNGHTLVCYGVGNFSHSSRAHYSASMWQIACALSIQSATKTPENITALYYDPCASVFERHFLEERGVNVLTTNDRGKLAVANANHSATLFFMPHCPKALYEHVVWANWHSLSRTIIVGNSIVTQTSHMSTTKRKYPCLDTLVPWIQETKLKASKQDLKEAPGNFLGAFNDTYCVRFVWSNVSGNSWPERPKLNTEAWEDSELL